MKTASIPAPGKDYTDEEIRSFVGDLESLPGGELTVALLVGCGERAIPPLREYLLEGVPRSIFQPRQRAVEALAQLEAKDVLFEYLSRERDIPDAVVRFGEEAIENTAARELSRWLTEDVYQFVVHLAEHRMRVGLIETLGEFERPEAASVLVRALEDGVCRRAAEDALRGIASHVKPVLVEAARRKAASGEEKPSERQRRRSALRLLAELNLSPQDWNLLRPLWHDEDKEIAVIAATIAVTCAAAEEKQEAAHFLIGSLEHAHWHSQIQIQDCLRKNYDSVRNVIAEELALRRSLVRGEPLADQVVRVLTSIQSSREKVNSQESRSHGERESKSGGK
jgi:hypothetical protein